MGTLRACSFSRSGRGKGSSDEGRNISSAARELNLSRRRGLGSARLVVRRYWDADGPSHSRALAYHSMLVLLSGFIGFIGLATVLDMEVVRATVEEWLVKLSPGPSGRVLREAASQGSGGGTAAILGLGTALIAGTRAMAQFQRASNRLWGIHEDRPLIRRYLVGLGLVLSSGLLLAAGAMVLAGGESVATGAGWGEGFLEIWKVVRWPLGGVVVALAILLLYRVSPRARPGARDLIIGTVVAFVLWMVFTAGLALYFSLSDRSTQTYGPLVGIVALLLWAALTSVALHIGMAVTAERSASGATKAVRRTAAPPIAASRTATG
jgi:YihY family inner membrane protein